MRRVVLFSSGVAYYQHDGVVSGHAATGLITRRDAQRQDLDEYLSNLEVA